MLRPQIDERAVKRDGARHERFDGLSVHVFSSNQSTCG